MTISYFFFEYLLPLLCVLLPLAAALWCPALLGRRVAVRQDQERPMLRLPPGSMGLPYLGETLHLCWQNPAVFFASKRNRYGDIFKTHLLGFPCVVLASLEAARFALVTQAHPELFKRTYPPSKERLIGPSALFFHQGYHHLRMRRLVDGSLRLHAVRALVPDVEAAVASTLGAWADMRVASTFHVMKMLSFELGITTIFGGLLDGRHKEALRRNYSVLENGYNCFPIGIPGTLYYRAVEARKRLREILGEIMADRRARGEQGGSELLGGLMRERDGTGAALTDDQIADNVIGVLYMAQDNMASVLTWILKYLRDYPRLLDAVKAEQMATYEANEGGRRLLTWAQTRSMKLTHAVIMESITIASVIAFTTFREAVVDVVYNDLLIPKGWKVMPLFGNHTPEYFQDPQQFDPSRFEVSPQPNTFLPFGSGAHACPGNELAKLELLVLVHRLVTGYRWELVRSSDGVQYNPFSVLRRGLQANLWKEEGGGAVQTA